MPSDKSMQKTVKYSSLGVLVLQNTSLVLFMKYAMTGDRPKFIKAISVFYGEIFKLIASLILCCLSHRSLRKGLSEIYIECVHKKMDFAKVLIPAVIYTIQNILLYIAVANLPASTFQVTYQLKVITTALFTVIVLKRSLSKEQWISLFLLFVGIAVVQYDVKMSEEREKAHLVREVVIVNATHISIAPYPNTTEIDLSILTDNNINDTSHLKSESLDFSNFSSSFSIQTTTTISSHQKDRENSLLGFASVLLACISSGLAGIYFEKLLKDSSVSIWVRNFQLAAPSIIFSLLFAFGKDNDLIFKDGFNPVSVCSNIMQGFDWAVWSTVTISALGGLIVAVVIKFADNILKAFATSFAIVINCVLAYFLFSFRPTMLFVLGAFMVIGAVLGFSIYPSRLTHERLDVEKGKDMKEIKEEDSKKNREEEELLNDHI